MSEIDHRAEALTLARLAAGNVGTPQLAATYIELATLHLDLHAAAMRLERPSTHWELAGQMEALTEAVRNWLDEDAGRGVLGSPFAQRVAELIDYRAPEA